MAKSSLYSTPKMDATMCREMNDEYSPLAYGHPETLPCMFANTVYPKFAYQSKFLLLSKTKLRIFQLNLTFLFGILKKNEWMKTIVNHNLWWELIIPWWLGRFPLSFRTTSSIVLVREKCLFCLEPFHRPSNRIHGCPRKSFLWMIEPLTMKEPEKHWN